MDVKIVPELVKQYGTPLYVYWENIITRQYHALSQALRGFSSSVCFAVKANSNGSILSLLKNLGAGFDIVSGGELERVLRIGCNPERIVFSGVGKTESEISRALEVGIRLFNVESESELRLIETIATSLKKKAPIAMRVNPNVAIDAHPYIATGLRTSKFGIPVEEIPRLWESIRSSAWLDFIGLDCHIGSQISDIEPLEQAYRSLLTLATELRGRGAQIQILDFGGGHGISFSGQYRALDLNSYHTMLQGLPGLKEYEIIVEPGKYLLAEAGVLVTQVVHRKTNGENAFVIVDAGMNDLIRPSLYDAHHHIEVIRRSSGASLENVDVVGPVCETGCFLGRGRDLPKVEPGDIVLVRDAGAYGFVMASNYNSRPLPAEVLIDRTGCAHLIRKRQAIEELWRDEVLI